MLAICISRTSTAIRRHSTATKPHSSATKPLSSSARRYAISKCFAPTSKPDYWGALCDEVVPPPTDIPSIQANFQFVDRKVEHLAEWSYQNEIDIDSLEDDERDLQRGINALKTNHETLNVDLRHFKADLQSLKADIQALKVDNQTLVEAKSVSV